MPTWHVNPAQGALGRMALPQPLFLHV